MLPNAAKTVVDHLRNLDNIALILIHSSYRTRTGELWDTHSYYRHYIDVIMTTVASQITSLTIVYSIVYSGADQRKHQGSASLAFVRGIHRDRWIPRTKGQWRGNCFHLMTSWWIYHKLFICFFAMFRCGHIALCETLISTAWIHARITW